MRPPARSSILAFTQPVGVEPLFQLPLLWGRGLEVGEVLVHPSPAFLSRQLSPLAGNHDQPPVARRGHPSYRKCREHGCVGGPGLEHRCIQHLRRHCGQTHAHFAPPARRDDPRARGVPRCLAALPSSHCDAHLTDAQHPPTDFHGVCSRHRTRDHGDVPASRQSTKSVTQLHPSPRQSAVAVGIKSMKKRWTPKWHAAGCMSCTINKSIMKKRCTYWECTKQAKGKTEFCVEHGGGKRCTHPECTKSAQGKTEFCVEHGGGKRCTHPECTKSAVGKTEFCKGHGGGDRCPHCKDWPDSRSGCKKYDGYCATCFKRVFPLDPRSAILYQKSHETAVRNYLAQHMNEFIHDTPIYSGNCECTHRRRIDFRMLVGGSYKIRKCLRRAWDRVGSATPNNPHPTRQES